MIIKDEPYTKNGYRVLKHIYIKDFKDNLKLIRKCIGYNIHYKLNNINNKFEYEYKTREYKLDYMVFKDSSKVKFRGVKYGVYDIETFKNDENDDLHIYAIGFYSKDGFKSFYLTDYEDLYDMIIAVLEYVKKTNIKI
jgi:hypothetical protein